MGTVKQQIQERMHFGFPTINSFNNAGVGQAKYIYAKNKYAIFNSKYVLIF